MFRRHDVELPVLPTETPVAWTRKEMRQMAFQAWPALCALHHALDYKGPETSLKTVLNQIDGMFDKVAETLGVQVVGHEWALYPGKAHKEARKATPS